MNRIYELPNWILKFYTRRTGMEHVPNREPNNTHIKPDEKPLYTYLIRLYLYSLYLIRLPFLSINTYLLREPCVFLMFYSHSLDFNFWMRKSFECYFGIGFDSFIWKYIILIWILWLQINHLEPNRLELFFWF